MFTEKIINSKFDKYTKTIEVILPNSIKIIKNECGYSLISRQKISKNEIIYTGVYYVISNNDETYTLCIKTEDGDITFNDISNIHSVKQDEETRQLYTFDGFMNHSCNCNSVSSDGKSDGSNCFFYDQIAIKDINIGDEITCNYLHFDYECDGHSFECLCKSDNCIKFVNGFKNCSLETKVSLLPYVDNIIFNLFKKDNPDILIRDYGFNENIELFKDEEKKYYINKSLKNFKPGEIVFKNTAEKIPLDKNIILNIKNNIYISINQSHCTRCENHNIFYTFDSFTSHSCNPNCSHLKLDEDNYVMVAQKYINIGDEITCDYSSFQSKYDTYSFICNCGENNCKGVIF
jgi:hypothetical protein